MSEWEEFAAYTNMIKRAKAEERERIVQAFMEKFTLLRYFHNGEVNQIEGGVDIQGYCEFVLREIIKETNDGN